MADELKHAVKITCEADPRNWLEFSRSITVKQRKAYLYATSEQDKDLAAAERAAAKAEQDRVTAEKLATAENDVEALARLRAEREAALAEIEAAREASWANRQEIIRECLRQTVVDGELVYEGDKIIRGIEAILAADADEATVIAASFMAAAPYRAFVELHSLGNAKRLG